HAAAGEGEKALPLLEGFATKWADSLYARDAALLHANLLVTLNHPQEALARLAPYHAVFRAEVELAAGRAYGKAGDAPKAAEALRRVYYGAPLSPVADDAGRELQAVENDPRVKPATSAERAQRADLLLQGRRYSDAAREYRGL